MQYRPLGNTQVQVSIICLGTMTWGEQNSEADAHAQMNYAVEQGVNFFDTAELYPVPPNKESWGSTETFIGNWFKQTGKREQIILASKVVGPGEWLTYMRQGRSPKLDKKNIKQAIKGSLQRLKTDYIDLYQVHWPDRQTNVFGRLESKHDPETDLSLENILEAMQELIQAGQIRYVGISNETAWGTMEYIRLSRDNNLPRIVSIQNPYSLIMRQYETALAEVSMREQVGLLVYSPLANGVLSGKYLGGKVPKGSRMDYFKGRSEGRYNPPHAQPAIQAYVDLAHKYDLDPAQMALAFVNSREFVTSNIIGATNMEQLKMNIASAKVDLSDQVIDEISLIHTQMPNPIV